MSKNHPIDDFVGHTRQYIETRVELGKLQLIEKGSVVSGQLAARLILFLLSMSVIAFFSIAAALYLGELLGKTYYGFAVIGGIYSLACLLLYLNSYRWIERPVAGGVIRSILNDQRHD
ncbi:MAG: hypothetical protein RL021_1748 [Bacteroidota bacterium]|jgi:hypothetical protein